MGRLINPNNSNMGKVSKQILQKLNNKLRAKFNFNQWRSTGDVIKWLKKLENKDRVTFIQFDIDNYYPSITAELLDKALKWAEQHVETPEKERKLYSRPNKTYSTTKAPPGSKNQTTPV